MAKLTAEDIILKIAIAKRIAELREKSGLTQVKFAEAHDIDRQSINRWENTTDDRGIAVYTVQRFCKMVGISLSEFFDSDFFE